ncbi:MAG TPA: zf-HC2 domain-containing protein [Ramlibacter sp.]
MLKCTEVTELCSRELDQEITLAQKISMRAHLMMCSGCSHYRRQLFTLRSAARRFAGGDIPGDRDGEPTTSR